MSISSDLPAPTNGAAPTTMRTTWFCVVGTIVGGLLASGTVMRVGAMSPSNLLGTESHVRIFALHGALTVAALFTVLVVFAPSRRASRGLRVTLAVAQATGAAMAGFSGESRSVFVLGCGVCLVTTVLFALLILDAKSWRGGLFLVATLAQAAAWAGMMVGWTQGAGASLYSLVLAIVVAPLVPPRSAARPLVLVGVVTYLLARAGVRFFGASPLALVELIAGVGLAVAVIRSSREEAGAWPRWVRRIVGLLFGEAVVLTAFLGIVGNDAHLHDTLFAVGAAHLEGLVPLFALLAGLSTAARTRWGWAGLSLAVVGAHVFCWGSVVLGARGMPRRYAQYLEQFAPLQFVTSLGALVMLAGGIACALAWLAARRLSLAIPDGHARR